MMSFRTQICQKFYFSERQKTVQTRAELYYNRLFGVIK